MTQTFKDIIKKSGSMSKISDTKFVNEIIRYSCLTYLKELTFARLDFVNCHFINIDFHCSHFISCDFTDSSCTQTLFLKSKLEDCNFKDSKIFKSELPNTEFIESNFINCEFNEVDMIGTFFLDCEFIKPKFDPIHRLNSAILSQSKIWNSEKWIKVNAFNNLEKIINELKD